MTARGIPGAGNDFGTEPPPQTRKAKDERVVPLYLFLSAGASEQRASSGQDGLSDTLQVLVTSRRAVFTRPAFLIQTGC